MKDWILGRFLMNEAGDEGGGGSSGGEGNTEGGTGDGTGAGDEGAGGSGEGEEKQNALGDELGDGGEEKPGEGEEKSDEGEGESKSGGDAGNQDGETKPPDGGELTEDEAKTYNDALKLDEKLFGEKADFDPFYRAAMPAFFKRHGIEPEKANKMANEFVAMQKKAGEKKLEELRKAHEERDAGMQRMNEAYYRDYDKPARETIGKAVRHFVKKGSAMWHTLVKTEVGVDKELLEILHFVGERLPNDSVRGGADGAGAKETKSISDSFMGR